MKDRVRKHKNEEQIRRESTTYRTSVFCTLQGQNITTVLHIEHF